MGRTGRPHVALKAFKGISTKKIRMENGASYRCQNWRLMANDTNFRRIFTLGVASNWNACEHTLLGYFAPV